MRNRLLVALGLLASVASTPAWAQEARVMARTRLEPRGPYVPGQQVRLVVDVLTTTFFTRAPQFPPVTATNAIITLPDENATNLNVEIQGERWFGLTRSYLVTPTGGDVTIAPFVITAYPGPAGSATKVRTTEVRLTVKSVALPPGQEHALAATSLRISQKLDRKLTGLRVGDAITRTIAMDAAGVQAMFLPPVEFDSTPGLSVYPRSPVVENRMTREQVLTGSRRVDAATYVVQDSGNFELPSIEVNWWNLSAGRAETARLPAIRFSAAANPAYRAEFALPAEHEPATKPRREIPWRRIGVIAAIGVATLLLAWWLAPPISRRLRAASARRAEQRRAYEASEPAAFERFERAARGGRPDAVYRALLAWAEHPDRPARSRGLDAFVARAADPRLSSALDELRASLYRAPRATASGSPRELGNEVRARRQLELESSPVSRSHLAPLNP
jgi:hypothetical protein